MKSSQRMTAFFGAMLLTFGITALDFENPDFAENVKEYVAIILGAALIVIYFVIKRRNTHT